MTGWGWCIREMSSLNPVDKNAAHTGLYIGGIFEIQNSERCFDQVTAEVSERAGTIIPPPAPAAWYEFINVVTVGGRAEPQIPVEFLWHFRFGRPWNPLRPDRSVRPYLHCVNVADNSRIVPFHQLSDTVT